MTTSIYQIMGMSCASCAMRIEATMRDLPGIEEVRVDLLSKTLSITWKGAVIETKILRDQISRVGHYDLQGPVGTGVEAKRSNNIEFSSGRGQILIWGLMGILVIALIFYLIQAIGMQSWSEPLSVSADKWYFVGPLIIGFGVQMALFRAIHLRVQHGGGGTVIASGGVSAGAMVACCTHNLIPLFPILGLSGVAALTAAYQDYILGFSLLMVIGGIIYMSNRYRRLIRSDQGNVSRTQ